MRQRKSKRPDAPRSASGRTPRGAAPPKDSATPTPAPPLIVVGIGASAGGLAPMQTLLSALTPGHGLAVVVVQHVQSDREDLLVSLLQDQTRLTVLQADDGETVAADHVYVMPADKSLSIIGGKLSVRDVSQCQGLRMPIDHFFCTLAADLGWRAVGVVLSGTGMDGSGGLAEIKALGGSGAVQDPATAEFPEMPQSAAACQPDAILRPAELANFLLQRVDELASLTAQQAQAAGLEAVLAALRTFTGHDFHCYKRGTLERRIRRRMALHHCDTYDDYAKLLRTNRDEPAALRKDLLIGVTEFFRQNEAWRVLEEKVLNELIAAAKPHSTLRVWVPACASGKEAYSLAMLLAEAIEKSDKKLGLQVFATDADAAAVEQARTGQYAEDDLEGVSQSRLRRFFVRKSGRYEVVKPLREAIVFAPQDLTSDPPFSKLDLISCRNLLIYLESSVQKKIIQLFHFALRDSGYLFLGSAENINGQDNLFEPVSQKWRIYRRLGVATPVGLDLPLRPANKPAIAIPAANAPPRPTLPAITQQAIAETFGPPAAVVVDRKGSLLYMHGLVEEYLQFAPGEHTGLLTSVAREGLRNRLASALLQAVTENKKVAVQARVKKDRRTIPVRLTVKPLRHPREADGLLLVTFEPQKLPRTIHAPTAEPSDSDARQLEDELRITREELSSTIGQLEQSNEHLKASNEEAMSANEELQSANEELETSKEELHSLNEELNAVNQRLQEKVIELEQASNDVSNLLISGNVATIFLDRKLCVRRFTPAVTRLLSLIESDLGRPIADIVRKFKDDSLLSDAERVLVNLSPAAADVPAEDGKWYQRRILPYRTREDRIEGVVITFDDVTELKDLANALRLSEQQARWLGRLPQENPNPVLRVSADGTVLYQNPAAQALPAWRSEVGQSLPQEMLRRLVGQAMDSGKSVQQDLELGGRPYWVAVAPITAECYANVYGRDIAERKQAEQSLQESEERVRRKLSSVLDPEGDMGVLELGDLVDAKALQKLMDDFYAVAHIPMSIIDLKGRILVGVGWQDICTKFHRVNKDTCRHCLESDLELTSGLAAGECRLYKCKNNLWDMATPIMVGGHHVGNIFTGQFFFEGEVPDREFFAAQARQYGFDQEPYLAALERVPKLSRETVDRGMGFFLKLAATLSQVGYSNVKLARLLAERGRLTESLRRSEQRLNRAQEIAHLGSWELDVATHELIWSDEVYRLFGLNPREFAATYEAFLDRVHPDDRAAVDAAYSGSVREGKDSYDVDHRVIRKDTGEVRHVHERCEHFRDASGTIVRSVGMVHDITDRKRAEEALRESEERLRLAMAATKLGTWDFNPITGDLNWDARCKELFGLPREATVNYETFLTAIHPDDRPNVHQVVQHSLDPAGGGLFDTQYRTVGLADGGIVRCVHATGVTTFNRDGQAIRFIGTVQDITEQEATQAALRQLNAELEQRVAERTAELEEAGGKVQAERQRFLDVLETLPVMITLIRPDYHVAFANSAYRQALGEAKGRRCFEYQFGFSDPCKECEAFIPLQTGKPHHWEWTLPTGRTFEIHNYPFTDADGTPMILEMDIDVTEARQAQNELRQASLYTRSLIEAAVDPLVTIGPDGRITDVNAATEEATGLGRHELVGTDFSDYFTQPKQARAGYQQVFREGAVRNYPLEIRHKDGHVTPVLYNARVYRDAGGRVIGVFAAARDVTELKKAEQALREANETLEGRVAERTAELARSNADLQQFAHIASHDLQEPLRMVAGFLSLLEERYKPQLDEKARQYISFSVEGAIRMSQLIQDLLEYSRVERQGKALHPTDTSRALALALANLRSAIHDVHATVTRDELPTISTDLTLMMQLFQNLIGNAIKFRSPDRPCQIHVGVAKKGGQWEFSVKDNGIGIPEGQRERVFVIFQRLHTREKYPGTGIGLAICKKIIERHGGKIWVESREGEGSTFFFTIPENEG